MDDERLSEDSTSERKKSDPYLTTTEKLKKRLESLAKERDCAVEMWNLAKEAAENKKEEAMKWASEADKLSQRMDEMQKDYSEAIKLMERKVELLESELGKATARNEIVEAELSELKKSYHDARSNLMKSSSELSNVIKERNDLKESLDQTKELLHQAEKVSLQARDKVADALAMAQDALANEASITGSVNKSNENQRENFCPRRKRSKLSAKEVNPCILPSENSMIKAQEGDSLLGPAEEKARLEDAMAEILTAAEQKLAKEVDKTRKEMEVKIEALQSQLHTLTIEKNRVALENESSQAEYRLHQGQSMEKTKALHHELEELRSKAMKVIHSLKYEEVSGKSPSQNSFKSTGTNESDEKKQQLKTCQRDRPAYTSNDSNWNEFYHQNQMNPNNKQLDDEILRFNSNHRGQKVIDIPGSKGEPETFLCFKNLDKKRVLEDNMRNLRLRRQSDLAQWHNERDTLRRQIAGLQNDTESLLAQLRRRQQPCPDCKDQRIQVDRYRKLAKKWEETADSVTQNFEKYLREAKESYMSQHKLKGINEVAATAKT